MLRSWGFWQISLFSTVIKYTRMNSSRVEMCGTKKSCSRIVLVTRYTSGVNRKNILCNSWRSLYFEKTKHQRSLVRKGLNYSSVWLLTSSVLQYYIFWSAEVRKLFVYYSEFSRLDRVQFRKNMYRSDLCHASFTSRLKQSK